MRLVAHAAECEVALNTQSVLLLIVLVHLEYVNKILYNQTTEKQNKVTYLLILYLYTT